MRSTFPVVLAAVLIVTVPLGALGAGIGPVEQFGPHAWTNWDAAVIKAQGFGVPTKSAESAAQALVMSRRAAIVDAYRNLLEASLEVAVRSRTAVEQAGVKWDTVETRIEGVIRNAAILEERQHPDGRYEVVMQMSMYGPGGLGQVVLPHALPAVSPPPSALPPAAVPSRPGALPARPMTPTLRPRLPQPPIDAGPYTGLVIVVDGVRLDRSMSPAIVTTDGQIVYGRGYWRPGEISQEFANQHGIVGYASSTGTATRGGLHPLVVHAVGVNGPPLSRFNTDIVVSPEDAARIREANARDRFLDRFKVDIVVAP